MNVNIIILTTKLNIVFVYKKKDNNTKNVDKNDKTEPVLQAQKSKVTIAFIHLFVLNTSIYILYIHICLWKCFAFFLCFRLLFLSVRYSVISIDTLQVQQIMISLFLLLFLPVRSFSNLLDNNLYLQSGGFCAPNLKFFFVQLFHLSLICAQFCFFLLTPEN